MGARRRELDESSSSSSDSESETELESSQSTNPLDLSQTSDKKLSLVDDEEGLLLMAPPPEGDDGEGDEDEGERDTEANRATDATPSKSVDPKDVDVDDKPKKKKKKKRKMLYICTSNCKYEVVRRTSKRFGFREVGDEDDWHLYWTDYSVALERVMEMKRYQKINHFPGMSEICRKDLLCRNLTRMAKLFPKEYNIFPKSWCLPADYGDFQSYASQKKNKTYILKPASGCQGKGIWVTKNPREVKATEHMVLQQYISKPFLIDGFKFDLRIYTLLSSCDPLRIFVFKDGLVRFATHEYHEPTSNNVDNIYMHLTNYAINKHSEDFVRDDEEGGSKRRIITVNRWFKDRGYDLDKLWNDIDDVIIKTIISAHPVLKHNYRTCFPNHVRGSACFEISGFDVMLDKKLKPYVIEVNHSPSFHTDAKLDKEIKEALINDTLNIVNCGGMDRRKCIEEDKRRIKERLFQRERKKETKEELEAAQSEFQEALTNYEDAHLGNFRRIFPAAGCEKYDKFFQHSGSLFQETAAFKARSEAARQQREDLLRKKEKMDSMLKKKKEARPESPNSRKRKIRRATFPSRKLAMSRQSITAEPSPSGANTPIDTTKPMEIVEEEELERISSLLQRDNLVRGLGIVEHVYRLLHCTPGTMGVMKADTRHPFSTVKFDSYRVVSLSHYRQKGSDNKYYRFHEENRPLSSSSLPANNKPELLPKFKSPSATVRDLKVALESSAKTFVSSKDDIQSEIDDSPSQADDFVARTGQMNIQDNAGVLSTYNYTHYTNPLGTLQAYAQPGRPVHPPSQGIITQPSGTQSQWQVSRSRHGTSLGQLVEKQSTVLNRGKYGSRKLQAPKYNSSEEYRQIASMIEAENEKKSTNSSSDWRMDNSSPQRRTYSSHSAQSNRRDSGTKSRPSNAQFEEISSLSSGMNQSTSGYQSVYSFPSMKATAVPHPPIHGLSVVSAPAPVVQRPDVIAQHRVQQTHHSSNTNGSNGLQPHNPAGMRSTKSQRIRGASNSMRLKQMELRETHAVVLS